MKTSWWIGGIAVGLSLACGGGMGGSAVGEYASSYAEYQAAELGIPCPTYNIGDEVPIGDLVFKFEPTMLVEPESELPWIQNHEERSRFGKDGIKALVVPYQIKNSSPVKVDRDVWFPVMGSDGENARGGSYNEKLYAAEHGFEQPHDSISVGSWMPGVSVNALTPAAAEGAVAHLKRWDEVKDEHGDWVDVVLEQAVVDLGSPTEGPHINPEKR